MLGGGGVVVFGRSVLHVKPAGPGLRGREGGAARGFGVESREESLQALALGGDEVCAVVAAEGGWDEGAGLGEVGGLGLGGGGGGVGGLLERFADQVEDVGCPCCGEPLAGGGHGEAVHEVG